MGTLRDIWHYLRVYRRYIGRRLYIVFVLTALTALAEGFGIALLLPLLDVSGIEGGDADGKAEVLYDLLSWLGIAESMVGILVFIAFVFLAKGLLKFAEGAYRGYLQTQLLREIKLSLFDGYGRMSYRYYVERNTGHFINVINGQANLFFNSFHVFTTFLSTVVMTVGYFAVAFTLTWKFSLMVLMAGVLVLALFKYLNDYVRGLSRNASQEMSQLNKLLVQSLQAFKYVISTNQHSHLREGVKSSVHRLTGYKLRQQIANAFTRAIKEPISIAFIIVIVAVQVAIFEQPIAPLFVAILLFNRGMRSMISIQSGWQSTMSKVGAVEMVDGEFSELSMHRERNGQRELGALDQSIQLHEVCFAYGGDEDALRDVSLMIQANTTVAFVGESGAGKSTLVDMLTLLLKPQRGQMCVDGVPFDEIDLASWRDQIGYVSQETVVFDDTIANNISLWGKNQSFGSAPSLSEGGGFSSNERKGVELQERVRVAAEQAHAKSFIEALPNGYSTVVGDRGVRLSGGQRQRLFLARELFKRPNLLILDEATSALDTESERYIQESIDALRGHTTVVIIAHRLSTIKNVDYVYVMDEGRVVEEGPYEELRSRDHSRFREMVEMQSL